MKKIYKIFILVLTAATLVACTKNENKQTEQLFERIRDPEFRRFLLLVYDKDVDFNLSNTEIYNIKAIKPGEQFRIRSFEGVEIFTNLEEVLLDNMPAKTIDLSKNRRLKTVYIRNSPNFETGYLPIDLKDEIKVYPEEIFIYK